MPGGFPLGRELCDTLDYSTDLVDINGGNANVNCGNGSKGSWVSLGTLTRDICALQFHMNGQGGASGINNGGAIDLGIGPGGSQIVIINDLVHWGAGGNTTDDMTPILPIVLPAGTSVWARGQAVGTGVVFSTELRTWGGSFDQTEGFAGVDGLGVNYTTAITGVNLATTTSFTKGAYSVIVSSTSRDYAGFFFNVVPDTTGTQINHLYVDIAVGPTGSEVIILSNWHAQTVNETNGANKGCLPFFIPTPIPAGTKISARFQTELASKLTSLVFYGVYR